MKLFSASGKHLKSLLFRALGKKANVMIYVIGKMNEHDVHEWTELDMDSMAKQTKIKPKKIKKTLKWLKKRNLIHYRSHAMLVKPTATLLQAKPFEKNYMNHHKDIKGQEERDVSKKHSLTD